MINFKHFFLYLVKDYLEEAEVKTKKTKREEKIEENFEKLKGKFADEWPEFKLRAWATMVVSFTFDCILQQFRSTFMLIRYKM